MLAWDIGHCIVTRVDKLVPVMLGGWGWVEQVRGLRMLGGLSMWVLRPLRMRTKSWVGEENMKGWELLSAYYFQIPFPYINSYILHSEQNGDCWCLHWWVRNWGTRGCSNLPRTAQLVSDGATVQLQTTDSRTCEPNLHVSQSTTEWKLHISLSRKKWNKSHRLLWYAFRS